jgi:hypothetical protein
MKKKRLLKGATQNVSIEFKVRIYDFCGGLGFLTRKDCPDPADGDPERTSGKDTG